MMFTIDLLKGKGVPEKTDLRRSAIRAAGLAVPLAALALLGGAWRYDHLQQQQQEACIRENEQIVSTYAESLKSFRQAGARVGMLQKQLAQAGRALQSRIQVTDLLGELTEKLPGDIFIHDIRLDRSARIEKYQPEGSDKVRQRKVIGRTLTMTLCNFNTAGGDRLVQDYADALKKSERLAALFKSIAVTACQQGKADDRDATFYSIECQLAEQIQ